MTKQINHNKNNNGSQTNENGFESNKGRNVSMAVIAGVGLTLMLVFASNSVLVQS